MPSSDLKEWKVLETHAASIGGRHMRDLFEADTSRRQIMRCDAAGLRLDYSRNRITGQSLDLLIKLAQACDLSGQRENLLSGAHVNASEDRPALHTALRGDLSQPFMIDGVDINADIAAALDHMEQFTDEVRSGAWKGATGKPIRTIVHIGIGGSYLGPRLTVEALRHLAEDGPEIRFLANIDGAAFAETVRGLDAGETLFIVASKSFTTDETMTNAHTARAWFLAHPEMNEAAIARHFVALSTNKPAVEAFGIDAENMFTFWDWVGGRYSVWSVIGMPLALQNGMAQFREFLAGAAAMDAHFATASFDKNMPVLLALIGIWNRNFLGMSSRAVLPYDHRLRLLPDHLQQVDMESNGKSSSHEGTLRDLSTGPVLFGGPGTDSQHSFFQLLHQGSDVIPSDFVLVAEPDHPYEAHHRKLLANGMAQMEALMMGRNSKETQDALGEDVPKNMLAQRIFPGNRPSNLILLPRVTAASLGALIALYEHRIFCEGVIWGINSFDQWGVELGKTMANALLEDIIRMQDDTADIDPQSPLSVFRD